MPTVLQVGGWRFYFYANERDEPMHIHAKKAEMECKFWLNSGTFSAELAYTHNMNPNDLRQVGKIVHLNFEQIEAAWQEFKRRQNR